MSLAQVRDGLADTLAAGLSGVNVYRIPPENITAPAVIVSGFSITPIATGVNTVSVELYAAVSKRNTSVMDDLDVLVDPESAGSIIGLLDADPSLGGNVNSVRLESIGEYRELEVAGVGYYAATVRYEVI